MSSENITFNAKMGRYQQEVVRWNRQINLVSRRDTLRRVAELVGQCRDAWGLLAPVEIDNWRASDRVWYFDVGSGGGLPGFVWHQLLGNRFENLATWLIEPREKRAWFLERLNQITPDQAHQVWNGRWGQHQVSHEQAPPSRVLVSLKALGLTDTEVLAGFDETIGGLRLAPGTTILIARFYPARQRWTKSLARELEIFAQPKVVGHHLYVPARQQVLRPAAAGDKAASLVVSGYSVGE